MTELFEPLDPSDPAAFRRSEADPLPSQIHVPDPPDVFRGQAESLISATTLFRVHSVKRGATLFNPGSGAPTRFGFFGDPVVPVLYAAYSQRAAVAESIFDEIPIIGGELYPELFRGKVLTRIAPQRELRMAVFFGLGLGAMNVDAETITRAPAPEYHRTVRWAEAAHAAGFDGIVWTSPRFRRDRVVVLFGDRVAEDELLADPEDSRELGHGDGLDWLIDLSARERIEVIV